MTTSQINSVAIVGGGPAGLYLAYRLKRRRPEMHVRVYEQNAADATFGFGVVFSDQALAFMAADDPETAAAITPHMENWQDMRLSLRGEIVTIDGIGFSAIGRLELLRLLQARAKEAGAELAFETAVKDISDLDWADLIVGADGLNSVVRDGDAAAYKASVSHFANRFIWYGTTKSFETLTQTFVTTEWGAFNAHHYRYAPDRSTFIIECGPETWHRAGFADLDETAAKTRCEAIFADTLDGHGLIANKSHWRNFPRLWNDQWSVGNRVLVGDALHTAHFSIGSGTRLAIEDAIALDRALELNPNDVSAALAAFQDERQPILKKLVDAANTSAMWYEDFAARMALTPRDFAFDYITRSGRVTMERLHKLAPRFAAAYEAETPDPIDDPVATDAPGSREIGFDRQSHANASDILFNNLKAGRGDRVAVHFPGGSLTYDQLCAKAAQYAHALRDFGLVRGERVILLLDDTPSCPAAFFGAMRLGFVPVVLNTLTPPELLHYYLRDTGAGLAISEASLLGTFEAANISDTALELVVAANGAATAAIKGMSEADFLAGRQTTCAAAPTTPDDMAFWLYSSGTTGRPKGIVHLHHDMAYTADSYGTRVLELSPEDICYSVPKIFFAYGLGNTLTFPFSVGASSVLVPGQPRPESVLSAIEAFRPTVFFGLPTLYTALARCPAAATTDFSSLRRSIAAAETLSQSIFEQWLALTGQEIVEGLGSTELLHIYLSNRPGHYKIGSAGCRVPGYEIELRNGEGRVLGINEEGVLWARADSSAPLYWNRPDKTAETMHGDWINTGDRFVRDADGFHFFKGRDDDLIKVSGQWVHPLEIERCLQTHPDIAECVVIAHRLRDDRMTLRACIALKDGLPGEPDSVTRKLQDFVKQALLPYKYPRLVTFLPELPKTGTGKLDRQALQSVPLDGSPRSDKSRG